LNSEAEMLRSGRPSMYCSGVVQACDPSGEGAPAATPAAGKGGTSVADEGAGAAAMAGEGEGASAGGAARLAAGLGEGEGEGESLAPLPTVSEPTGSEPM
jgi:hypothetical protein